MPAAWIRDHMSKAESMAYCRTKALPSPLFGGGIANEDGSWATTVGNSLYMYRVPLGYEQSPGKGQKAAPNLAVEEQSGASTQAVEITTANASLTNRLTRSKGPGTWPRAPAKARLAKGNSLGLQMPKHPQTSNQVGKKRRARKATARIAAQSHRASRAAGATQSEGSNRRLYCSLTKGVIPQVFLERQMARLAPSSPLVGQGSNKHCKRGLHVVSPMESAPGS